MRPSRPIINNGDVNIGNRWTDNRHNNWNRPGWDRPSWDRPDWGWGGGWAGQWHDHCIRPHYGWYNGCWNNYWGSNWYAPLAWGAVGWGLGALTSGWGFGSAYYNPYYAQPVAAAVVPYDYSQPVVVSNYVSYPEQTTTSDTGGAAAPQPTPETPEAAQATALFDEGLARFKAGDYQAALTKFNEALRKLPGDPVIHEVRAVTLFALGEYQQAAAALNSFLAAAPGMDWTSMSSLYGNVDDYQTQLRKLEAHCQANPHDASAYFVLAYQYLVIGAKDAAIDALRIVVREQPKDATAQRMLAALAPPDELAASASAPQPAPEAQAGEPQSQTDLVGSWQAQAGDTTIELSITADSRFNWKATPAGKPPVSLAGELAMTGDNLVLESQQQGSMAGSVRSIGPDQWRFTLTGAPPADPGLTFNRIGS